MNLYSDPDRVAAARQAHEDQQIRRARAQVAAVATAFWVLGLGIIAWSLWG